MVLGGATSKIRQQALISLHSQSRHSRAAVEGEGVSVSEKQVGSGEEPLQGPLWQGLSPPEPARRKALDARAQASDPPSQGEPAGRGTSMSTWGSRFQTHQARKHRMPRDSLTQQPQGPRICRHAQSLLAEQRVCSQR